MGRPLNKKFFGNRNIGSTSTTADNGIGGGAVASVSAGTVGSFVVTDTYKNFPTLTVAVPTLPGGVRAVLTPVYELDTVTFASGGQTDGDYLAGLSTTITGLGGGAVVNIVEVGNKVTAVNLTGGNRGEFRRGDFDGTGITSHQVLQAPNAGTDLQITVTFRVKSIEVTEAGSGYSVTPALTWGGHTFTGQTAPSAQTVTMLTDSGNVGTVGNQENAILMTAFIDGGSALSVDIKKQVSGRRYKVTDGTLTGIVKLTGSLADAAGECSVAVLDSAGGEYFATKITAHKATLTVAGGSGHLYTTGQQAPWKLVAPVGVYVQLANA
jgi:hypothetical protein